MRVALGAAATLAVALVMCVPVLAAENDASEQVVSNETKAGPGDTKAKPGGTDDPSPQTEADAASGEKPVGDTAPVAESPPVILDPFATALTDLLTQAPPRSAHEKSDRAGLAAFYEARGHQPLWTTPTGFSDQATAVMQEMSRAGDWGLDASEFVPPTLPPDPGKEQLAGAEVKLGMTVLKYARQAHGGRVDPSSLTKYLDRTPPEIDPKLVLEQLAAAGKPDVYLRGLNPKHVQFERLRQAYLALRDQSPVVATAADIPNGPTLKPGMRHAHVPLIRTRLGIKYTGSPEDETLYDDALVAAVTALEEAHGFRKPNGIISAATRRALNDEEPPSAARLLANMEAWRWMPEDLGDFYIWVNVPEFTIRVVKDGKVIHAERIVVGKTDTQTPIFSHELEQVIFHPFWGVPDSIKRNELQPNLANGGSILTRQGLRVQYRGRDIDPEGVDWRAVDMRTVHIYQPPGPSNVLGVVKFRFPNKHDVYFHDTPQKHLFKASVRAFSHGCMRVQNPVRVAEIILAHDKSMSGDRVRALASRGAPDNNQINLTSKIPVHITYFTASVDDAGKTSFFKDLYGHERRITLALEGKRDLITEVREPKAPPIRVGGPPQYSSWGGFPSWGGGSSSSSNGKRPDWARRIFNNF